MTKEEVLARYRAECHDISDECIEEGYPSCGSNYELRCSQLWEDYYQSEYDNAE